MSGRIYGDFTRHDNVGEYNYIHGLPVYLSIDFGYRMPCALFFQVVKGADGLEHIYLIDEITHKTNMRTLDLVNAIKAKNYRLVRVFGDPAGYQVQASVGMGEAEKFYQMTGHRAVSYTHLRAHET